MPSKSKRKGSDWERQLAKKLTREIEHGKFKRVPGSGALGTIMDEPRLTADVVGNVLFIPKGIKIEAKTGYGGHTQLTLKREWLEKIREQADCSYGLPVLACKFSGAKSGIKQFVALDMDAFIEIMNIGNKLYDSFINLQDEYDALVEQMLEVEDEER